MEPLIGGVSELIKNFPIGNSDGKTLNSGLFADALAYIHRFGVDSLFGITLTKDFMDSSIQF